MKNHFDDRGNYINCENLSLAEIYKRGWRSGKNSSGQRMVSASKLMAKLGEIKAKAGSKGVQNTIQSIIEYIDYFADKFEEE